MSDQVLIAIITVIGGVLVAGLSAIVAIQSNRLKAQEIRIDEHVAEQGRQKDAIAKLDSDAKDRAAQRAQERDEDRKDQQQLIDSLKATSDFYRERWQEEAKIATEQRTEIKELTQQSIEAYKANDKLQREFTKADQAHADDILELKKKTAELEDKSRSLTQAQETIDRQQKAFDRMTAKFDDDIKKINDTNNAIILRLQTRIAALEEENLSLKQELLRIGKLIGSTDYAKLNEAPLDAKPVLSIVPPDEPPTPPSGAIDPETGAKRMVS